MLKKKNHSLDFPLLPIEIQNQMKEFLLECISSIPEKNIKETVSEFATNDRSIGSGLTANFGPFSWYKTPFNREIADCLSDSSQILEVYVIKPTQVGFTVCITENHIGYCIKHGIGPGLYVGGDQMMAEEQMVLRIDDMIYESGLTDKIRENIVKNKGKGTGDTISRKSYGGTFFRVVGPNSESKAASFPARWIHLDEMDKYPVRLVKNGVDSGDIVMKFIRRQDGQGKQRKTLGGSTPKSQSISRIEPLVEEGDKRYYNITCPKCKMQHPLLWSNFKWDKKEDGSPDFQFEVIDGEEKITKDPTYHECPNEACKYQLRQKDKYDILQEVGYGGTAEWIPSKKADRPFIRSYVLNGLYGFRDWTEIMTEWIRVQGDPFLLPDFINDVLGETWKENVNKPDEHELLQLSQQYEKWNRGTIKKEIVLLTLTADIQKDRIEAGLMGWAPGKQAFMIDYWTFKGDPSTVENKCWKELSEKITAKYVREDKQEIFVTTAFIDSQYLSDTVDLFCDSFPFNPNFVEGVFPVQSRESQDKLVKNAKSNIKTPVVTLSDQDFKRALYNVLRKRPQGTNSFPMYYLHFSHEYGPEFYKQLTSEEIETIKIRGVIKGIKILNTKQRRNEVLDIVKMHLAAFQYTMDRFFMIYNEGLKLQKRPEIQEDASLFFEWVEVNKLRG